MALSARHWWLGLGLGAAALAVLLLPPSADGLPLASSWLGVASRSPEEQLGFQGDSLARRQQHLSRALAVTERRLQVLALRDTIAQRLRTAPAGRFTLLFSGAPSGAARARAEALQREISADLMRLDTTRVRVVLLVTATEQDYFWLRLLLPDPSHPDVCALTVSDPVLAGAAIERRAFGPCVFYAAFGNPGPAVRTWLVNRRLDVARDYAWWEPDQAVPAGTVDVGWWRPAFLDFLEGQRFPGDERATPAVLACQAGRVAACRRALFAPLRLARSLNGSERVIPLAWPGRPRSPGLDGLLAALVRRFGPERFGRFWRSQDQVEDAFAAEFGMAPARWGEDWVVHQFGRTYTGPVIRWSGALIWLGLAALAVAASAVVAARRQAG